MDARQTVERATFVVPRLATAASSSAASAAAACIAAHAIASVASAAADLAALAFSADSRACLELTPMAAAIPTVLGDGHPAGEWRDEIDGLFTDATF